MEIAGGEPDDDYLASLRLIQPSYVSQLKFVTGGLDRVRINPNDTDTLFRVYKNTLKRYFTDSQEPIHFIHHVLVLLGHNGIDGLAFPPGYDARTKYPGVYRRLLALEFIKSLQKKRELCLLREHLHVKKNIPYQSMTTPLSLTRAMFEQQVITKIDDLEQLASCFDLKELVSVYHSHIQQGQGSLEGQGPFQGAAEVDSLEKLKANVIKLRKKRKNRQEDTARFLCGVIPLVIVILIALVSAVATIVARRYLTVPLSQTRYANITDNSTVLLGTEFSQELSNIELSLLTNDNGLEVDVYKQNCNDIEATAIGLVLHDMPFLHTDFFKRQPWNYNGEDIPLYGVKGTHLEFHVSASSTMIHPGCPKISIFRDHNLYRDATKPGINGENNLTTINGIIARSPCLAVNNDDTIPSTWNYTFNETGYVYSTIDEGTDMNITGNITGTRYVYNLNDLEPVCTDRSTLTTDSNSCTINVCGSLCLRYKPQYCIFFKSNGVVPAKVKYKTNQPILLRTEFIIGIIIVLMLMLLVLLVPVCCCNGCHCPQMNNRRTGSKIYVRMDDDTDFCLVESAEQRDGLI